MKKTKGIIISKKNLKDRPGINQYWIKVLPEGTILKINTKKDNWEVGRKIDVYVDENETDNSKKYKFTPPSHNKE